MYKNSTFGNQQFNPGITLEEISDCIQEWSADNVGYFNRLTEIHNGRYIIAPQTYGNGIDDKEVAKMWKLMQSMDRAGYDYINWQIKFIGKVDQDKLTGWLFIPPPPPPPPPGLE